MTREQSSLEPLDPEAVHEFGYDAATGELGDREVFSVRSGPGMYDGLTVDASGSVWSALWEHGALVQHDHGGRVQRTIDLPPRNVTSLTFAGPDFTTAYVTSAARGADEDDEAAGALFRVEPGVEGVAEFRSNVSI